MATLPAAFEVSYDDARIDPTHSYALIAAIVDGDSEWNTQLPVPVITGGPAVNVEVPVVAVAELAGSIAGTIAVPADVTLSDKAVATAILIKEETGTLVSTDTIAAFAGASAVARATSGRLRARLRSGARRPGSPLRRPRRRRRR